MRENLLVFGILVVLVIFIVVQTIQIYNLKNSFNEIKEISKELNLKNGGATKIVQREGNQIPESLKEVPSVVQGCFS